jgi:hypothetical protein
MQGGAIFGEAAEDNAPDPRRRHQRIRRHGYRDVSRAIGGETVDAGGNRGEGDRSNAMSLAEFDGAAIARRQGLVFALAPTVPDRAHGMDHMPRRQPIPLGDLGIAGRTAMERAAFGQKLRPGRAMDRAIDTAPTKQ